MADQSYISPEKQEISVLTININICEEVSRDLSTRALVSCLLSICTVALNEPVKSTIAQSNYAISFGWLIDLLAFIAVLYAVVSTIESIAKKWKCGKLQNKLIKLLIKEEEPKATPSSSWLAHAGAFKDDPFFDEFVEDMAANRRQLDAEVNAWLDAEENNQEDPKNTSN